MYIFHPNKSDQAETDYILYNKLGSEIVKFVSVESCVALNTSDHVPVHAVLNLEVEQMTPNDLIMRCKPKWEKCDTNVYERFISGHLKPFSSFGFGNSAEYDILYPLSHLLAILRPASEDSIPSYKSEVRIKKKRQRPWTKQIRMAVKNSRLA